MKYDRTKCAIVLTVPMSFLPCFLRRAMQTYSTQFLNPYLLGTPMHTNKLCIRLYIHDN